MRHADAVNCRPDAVTLSGTGYAVTYVPTSDDTRWVHTMAEFDAAGGVYAFNHDQTQITLKLPAPFKFSIQFNGV